MSSKESESNSIIELQNKILEFQRRERAYIVEIYLKNQEISNLTSFKESLEKQIASIGDYKNKKYNNHYADPTTLHSFKNIKNIIKEKDALLLSREEELNYFPTPSSQAVIRKMALRAKELQKENLDLYNYIQGNTIENMRQENALEKSQIEQLMLKLKDNEAVYNDFINQIDEANETISFLKRKKKPEQDLGNEEINKGKKDKDKDK